MSAVDRADAEATAHHARKRPSFRTLPRIDYLARLIRNGTATAAETKQWRHLASIEFAVSMLSRGVK